MSHINQQLLAHSTGKSLRHCLLALLLCFGGFALLIPAFSASTAGLMPLDNQFPLSPEAISQQLALYTSASRRYYAVFALLDFIFPPLFSLCFALFWGWMLTRSRWQQGLKLASLGLLLLPFASAITDWMENIANLLLIFGYPPYDASLGHWAIAIKYTKLVLIAFNIVLTLALGLGCYRSRAGTGRIDPDQSRRK